MTNLQLRVAPAAESEVNPSQYLATVELFDAAGNPVNIDGLTADQITDATAVGRDVLTATDAAAARDAIGAGTSDLELGTTPTTAKAGNWVPAAADITDLPVTRTGGSHQLQLDGEELIWPNAITNGKIRLWNTTADSDNTFYGFGIANGALEYQVDSDTSKHTFQGVDDSDAVLPILEMSASGGVVSHTDLHMSEQKIVNLGAPTAQKDAATKGYVDAATAEKTQIAALTQIADPSTATVEDVANAVNAIIAALQA